MVLALVLLPAASGMLAAAGGGGCGGAAASAAPSAGALAAALLLTSRSPMPSTFACMAGSGSSPPNCCAISGAAWSPSATSCSGVMPATCCFSSVTGLKTLLPK